jgi:hypothetical protein
VTGHELGWIHRPAHPFQASCSRTPTTRRTTPKATINPPNPRCERIPSKPTALGGGAVAPSSCRERMSWRLGIGPGLAAGLEWLAANGDARATGLGSCCWSSGASQAPT